MPFIFCIPGKQKIAATAIKTETSTKSIIEYAVYLYFPLFLRAKSFAKFPISKYIRNSSWIQIISN